MADDSQMHTLLCLLAKGKHLEVTHGRKSDDPDKRKQHAYFNITTELNEAVRGKVYDDDLTKYDVTKMIDKMLHERKAVVGRGGYMERQAVPRITRGLKMMWERPTRFDFDGSKAEWKLGRKAEEQERKRIADGGAPREDIVITSIEDREDIPVPGIKPPVQVFSHRLIYFEHLVPAKIRKPRVDSWVEAEIAAAANRIEWGGNEPAIPTTSQKDNFGGATAPAITNTSHDSFGNLPQNTRKFDKFQWMAANLPPKPSASIPGVDLPSQSSAARGGGQSSHEPSIISSTISSRSSSARRLSVSPYPRTSSAYESSGTTPPATSPNPWESSNQKTMLPPKPPTPLNQLLINNLSLPARRSYEIPPLHIGATERNLTSTFNSSSSSIPDNEDIISDIALSQTLKAALLSKDRLPPPEARLPLKPNVTFPEGLNPGRRALMDLVDEAEAMDIDEETFGTKAHKASSANAESLPFNRLNR